jgi:hypothetical protein
VGAASSRDRSISRLEAAPTRLFYGNLGFLDKRLFLHWIWCLSIRAKQKMPGGAEFGAVDDIEYA